MKVVSFLLITSLFLLISCKSGNENKVNNPFPNASKYFAAIENAQQEVSSISNKMIGNPQSDRDYTTNDSLMYLWGIANERFLESLGDAYGNVPTDSLLKNSGGYIPSSLLSQLQPKDWKTEIGKEIKKKNENFLSFFKKYDELVGVAICDDLNLEIESKGEQTTLCSLTKEGLYLIDLWASWCAPCRTFNRAFQKDYPFFKNQDIEIIGISIDKSKQAFEKASQKDNIPWKDYLGNADQILEKTKVSGVPFQFLVKDGKIEKIIFPDRTKEELIAYLEMRDK